jgi:hypothetical protein
MNPAARRAADLELARLYGQIPEVGCRGLCQEACGPIVCSTREREVLRGRGVRLLPVLDQVDQAVAGGYTCPALTEAGQCAVYDARPMLCRLYGAVEDLRCPYGCAPAGGPLSAAQGRALLDASTRAGR